jgi:hypothetical protein
MSMHVSSQEDRHCFESREEDRGQAVGSSYADEEELESTLCYHEKKWSWQLFSDSDHIIRDLCLDMALAGRRT